MVDDIIKFRIFGERAIELEWPQELSRITLNDIKLTSQLIKVTYGSLIEDLIPTYTNLLVIYKQPRPLLQEIKNLRDLYHNSELKAQVISNRWYIPVCYDNLYGLDLEALCQVKKISIGKLIGLHANKDYPIHFYGFLPGFFYLSGLDNQLHYPRKKTPRTKVVAGSVAIGGAQTGVYPQDSPGGWNIIGATPIQLFNSKNLSPVFAKVGDLIHFVPIDRREFERIKDQGDAYILRKEVIP